MKQPSGQVIENIFTKRAKKEDQNQPKGTEYQRKCIRQI